MKDHVDKLMGIVTHIVETLVRIKPYAEFIRVYYESIEREKDAELLTRFFFPQ
jgi:hypothetical protein